MIRCSICHTRIADADETTNCPDCAQGYHSSCWNEMGGCGTYGCKQAPTTEKAPPPVVLGSGWGDSKTCPSCNGSIGSSLLLCRCGAKFPYADPMTTQEFREWTDKQQGIKRSKQLLTAMFIGSLIGLTAPVCGLVSAIYGTMRRDRLAGEHGTYLALASGSATLGVVYTVIIVLLVAGA